MGDVQFLRNFPFFEHLADENLAEICTYLMQRTYEKGVYIFREKEMGDELYIIKSGVVKISRSDLAREVILSIFRDGDFFGEMALMQEERNRSASAYTLEESTLYILKRKDFITLLESNPVTAIKILETALNRLRSANELISDLTILDARLRLARTLLRLGEQYGIESKDGILIDLKLTHQQMAEMTGTVRETVTKSLLDLQQQAFIRIDKRRILISDVDGLREFVESS